MLNINAVVELGFRFRRIKFITDWTCLYVPTNIHRFIWIMDKHNTLYIRPIFAIKCLYILTNIHNKLSQKKEKKKPLHIFYLSDIFIIENP